MRPARGSWKLATAVAAGSAVLMLSGGVSAVAGAKPASATATLARAVATPVGVAARGSGRAGPAPVATRPDPTPDSAAPAVSDLPLKSTATAPLSSGAWSSVGPTPDADLLSFYNPTGPMTTDWGKAGGRVTAVVALPATPSTVYIGTAGGGVWKSTDSGASWTPMSDSEPSSSIGALAVSSTGSVVFAGTGEDNFNQDRQPGQGILKSVDGGSHWTLVGHKAFAGRYIGGMAIDPTTSGATMHVFAASSGGLYESVDAGKTWVKNTSFSAAAGAGATQIIPDPTTPTTFWATSGADCLPTTAVNARVLVSPDSGKTWTKVFDPAPSARIGLAVGTAGVAYAAVANCNDSLYGIYKTSNGGQSWPATGQPSDFFNLGYGGQGEYDNIGAVDPTNNQVVVFAGIEIIASTDGGSSWATKGKVFSGGTTIHPDFHALDFTAAGSFYVGNDGGIYATSDLGSNWTDLNNGLGAVQFRSGAALDTNNVLGAAQDNAGSGFLGAPTKSWPMYGGGGDGGSTAIDPTGSGTVYTEANNLSITQSTKSAPTPGVAATPCGCANERTAFVAPYVMDPSNPKRLFAGSTHIYESRVGTKYTGGVATPPAKSSTAWTEISGDLTTGGFDTLKDIAVGPAGDSGVIYTVSADGMVSRSTNVNEAQLLPNGQATWTDITGNLPAMPATAGKQVAGWDYATSVVYNPWNVNEAWVSIGFVGVPHIWHTTNAGDSGGTTWVDISGNMSNQPVLDVVVDPRTPSTVYAATSSGVLVCHTCAGLATGGWSKLGQGLPNVWTNRLTLTRDNQHLVAWTYGRGAWMIATLDTKSATPITEFPEISGGFPQGMVAGPGGPWFTDSGTGQVGKVNSDGTVTMYAAGAASDGIEDLAIGSDGNIYFTASNANYIGMIHADGTGRQTWAIPDPNGHPTGITTGPDGNIWLVETDSDVLDQFLVTTQAFGVRNGTPTHSSRPEYITPGSDGLSVWFTEFTGLKIAKSDMSGNITEYAAPTGPGDVFGPYGAALGPDGKVWFGNFQDDNVTSVTPSGAVMTTTGLGAGHSQGPSGITTGNDEMMWVADAAAQSLIARVDPVTRAVTDYTTPTVGADAWGIAPGPDGNIWFTESRAGKVARMQLSQG